MTTPQLEFTQTDDGVTIAYWRVGSGPPLLLIAPGFGSSSQLWEVAAARAWYESLAEHFTLIGYDSRGWRMSQQQAEDYSPQALARDIAAVVEAVAFPTMDVLVTSAWLAPMLHELARSPDRFGKVIFWAPYLTASGFDGSDTNPAILRLQEDNFDAMLTALGSLMLTPELRDSWDVVEFWRANVLPAAWKAISIPFSVSDVSDLIPTAAAPSLVLAREASSDPPIAEAQRFAAAMPGAKLAIVPGESLLPFLEDADAVTEQILGFLQPGEPGDQGSGTLRTILFTDVENSTDLVVQHGDAIYRGLLAEHERLVREALAEHSGNEIKTIGDSFMCWFSSASSAIDAASAMQRAITSHYGPELRIRIGIHAGEPIQEADGDLYGTSVVRASRIMGQADGGQILVSQVVTDLVEGKGYLFSDAGEFALKGYERAVHLFDVAWEAE